MSSEVQAEGTTSARGTESTSQGDEKGGLGIDASASESIQAEQNFEKIEDPGDNPVQFSVYSTREKWAIIALSAVAAVYSPLTATSYFPVIPNIASAFHTSVELINVTVTVYMFLQGFSPMLWGTIADHVGRRPMFLACMGILLVSCVGVALVPTHAYWLLVVLRCFQAAGSASTVAIGSGTISDIAEPKERGGFVGLFSLGALIGPCIGPIIGGVVGNNLGWRAIFWFLAIAAGVYFVVLLLLFPETLRTIVGNGSTRPRRWLSIPLIPILTKYDRPSSAATHLPPPKKFVNPLLQFTHPTVVCILIFSGMACAVWYGVTTTIATLFAEAYPYLNESQIGLCYLAIGFGCGLGSYTNGRVLDAQFLRARKMFEREREGKVGGKDGGGGGRGSGGAEVELEFPIEYARLRLTPIHLTIFVVATIGYGWSVQSAVHISCPLILQFILSFFVMCILNTSQTILMDIYPTQGSSIMAANNLVRCTMGATLVSIIDFILRALRPGWTYVLLSALCVLVSPLVWMVVKFGPMWRARRKAKEERRA